MRINTHVDKADLHGHTVNSDGELTVLELLECAKNKKLDYYAITDHDVFAGADEAYELIKTKKVTGINVIYGIELSTYTKDESVHVLGYFKERISDTVLNKCLIEQAIQRKNRAYKMFDLLETKFNIVLDRKIIEEKNSITRGTIARLIIKSGYDYTIQEIFNKLIGEGCPCYLPSTKLSTQEGIKLIKESGGIAVLAHPCLLEINDVQDIVSMGIDGIEAIYPRTFNEETKYRDIAKKYNLVITAGSDFHIHKDSNHGEVGSCIIKGIEVEKFLKKLYN